MRNPEDELQTLLIEYNSAVADAEMQRRTTQRYEQAASNALTALSVAIVAAGLTEYGPIGSYQERDESGKCRRVWFIREDSAR